MTGSNNQSPSADNQIMTKIPMSEILIPLHYLSPLRGEEKGEEHFLIWRFGHWNLFGIWNLDIGI
jgi:hypothetical protein